MAVQPERGEAVEVGMFGPARAGIVGEQQAILGGQRRARGKGQVVGGSGSAGPCRNRRIPDVCGQGRRSLDDAAAMVSGGARPGPLAGEGETHDPRHHHSAADPHAGRAGDHP